MFRIDDTEQDYAFLENLVEGRRIAIFEQDSDDDTVAVLPAVQTYRVAGELESVSTTHYQVELESDSPSVVGLTDDDDYILKLLDSVEIFV